MIKNFSIAKKIACGVGVILTLAAAYLFVPPPREAAAQFADQGTWGGTSGGTANAQTITIGSLFANKPGIILRFVPGTGLTNTGPTQINVSGIGLVNVLRPSSNGLVAFSGGEFQAGEMTCVSYNPAASAYQLACNVDLTRIGQAVEFRGPTAPRGTLIEDGTCYSQTGIYAPLFAVIGTTYNALAPVGCSGSQFAVPDSRGTAFVALDGQGANGLAGRITTASCATPNAVGECGHEQATLTASVIPTISVGAGGQIIPASNTAISQTPAPGTGGPEVPNTAGTWTGFSSLTSTGTGGTSPTHPVLNPSSFGRRAIKY